MPRRRLLVITLLVLASLFFQGLPPTPVRAQGEPPPLPLLDPGDPHSGLVVPESKPLEIPNLLVPALPSLSLQLRVEPETWIAVGDLITATLTVANQGEVPAEDLTLTMALPADAAPADSAQVGLGAAGWQWALGTLPSQGQTVVTATLRLTAVPAGEALVLEPAVTARGLDLPVVAVGGALVSTDPDGVHPPAQAIAAAAEPTPAIGDPTPVVPAQVGRPQPPPSRARFTPGQPTTLHSRDGHVSVTFPAQGFDRPLTLDHRTLPEQRPFLRTRGQNEPPAHAGTYRGFGAFFLEAMDEQGRNIHRFTAPLTISVRFTPSQLRVLHMAPEALTLYWFDDTAVVNDGPGRTRRGQWVPLPTYVDVAAGIATATVDHFTGFQLSDGTSASAAYLPSLQGWQVSGFTGAASFSYPIDVPAGPNGIKPDLSLSYSSAATDGAAGMRNTTQASWVGKGWSLDTGSVSLNKIDVSSGTQVNHYALTFNGRSFDMVRGAALVSNPDSANPTHWEWRPTDESFIRVRAVSNGASTPGGVGAPGRGAYDYSSTYERYQWLVWDKSGTLFTFAEDMWWAWANCSGSGAFAYFESNRWLLSSITDTFNNTVLYTYARSNEFYNTCAGQSGTVDFDVWPTTITWAGNRYMVEFVSSARANDTQYDFPAYTPKAFSTTIANNPSTSASTSAKSATRGPFSLPSSSTTVWAACSKRKQRPS